MAKQDIDAAKPDEFGHFTHHFSITMEMDKHPWMMLMAGAAVIIFLVYLFGKLKGAGTGSTNTSTPVTPVPVDVTNPNPIPVTLPPTPNPPPTGNPPPPPTGNPPPPPTGNPLQAYTVVRQGALSSIYGGVHNGGYDILTLHPGDMINMSGNNGQPVSWGGNTYYATNNFAGHAGWYEAADIGK